MNERIDIFRQDIEEKIYRNSFNRGINGLSAGGIGYSPSLLGATHLIFCFSFGTGIPSQTRQT